MVLEAFVDLSLEDTSKFLSTDAPDVSVVEVGAGGYAPNPHCDVDALLADEQARRDWLVLLDRYDIGLDALNAWGNPVHPDPDVARVHDHPLRQAIRLALALGADRMVAMAGCPGGGPADLTPHFGAGGWLPYLEGIHHRQWTDVVAPYWADLAAFARAENRICRSASSSIREPRSTTSPPSRSSSRWGRLSPRTSIPATSSEWGWTATRSPNASAIASGTSTARTRRSTNLAFNGMLDHRWPTSPELMPWNFSVLGRGHDLAWWTGLMSCLEGSPARSCRSSTRTRSCPHRSAFRKPQSFHARRLALQGQTDPIRK